MHLACVCFWCLFSVSGLPLWVLERFFDPFGRPRECLVVSAASRVFFCGELDDFIAIFRDWAP
jgi:hypothetical protein